MGLFKPNVERLERKKNVEGLIKALKHEDVVIRRLAAKSFTNLKNSKAAEPLLQALSDEDSHVRNWAATALGEIGDTRAVQPLLQRLKDSGFDQFIVAEALAKLGYLEVLDSQVIAQEIQELEKMDVSAVRKAIERLGRLKDVRAIGSIARASSGYTGITPTTDGSGERYIARIATTSLISIIIGVYKRMDIPKESLAALRGLSELEIAAIKYLIYRLDPKTRKWDFSPFSPDIKKAVIFVLGKIGEPAISGIKIALKDKDEGVRKAAEEALKEIE